MRIARRWRVAALVAACSLVVAACSSEPESSTPTVELSTTTVTTLPPTTETTEAPTTTIDPRVAEVEAAVAAFHDVQLLILLDSEQLVEQIEDVATGQVSASVKDNTLRSRAEASYYEGSISADPLSTSFGLSDSASHVSCTLDAIAQFDSDGVLVIAADQVPALWTYDLALIDGAWLVSAISIGDPCVTS